MKNYGKFSEEVDLSCDQTYLLGPFNCMPKDSSTPAHALIDVPTWIQLNEICEARSILPPTIGQNSGKTAANVVLLRQKLGGSDFGSVEALPSLKLVQYMWENAGLDK